MASKIEWPILAYTDGVTSKVIVVLETRAASADSGNGIINQLLVPGHVIMRQNVARLFFCPVKGYTGDLEFLPIPAALAYLEAPAYDLQDGVLRDIEADQGRVSVFFDLYPDLKG